MAQLEPGSRFSDRFVLQERIGDGGHAEIWAAWDEQRQQRVALKFLHADACGADEAWAVLQHESNMVQRLAHPGVLRTETPQRDGRLVFLPMEHAAGGDLKRLRGMTYLQLVPVLIQVARILEHAHAQGVVHRDIKPGNVLFDEQGGVRVADFGASAACGSAESLAAGSPFTASPQQLRGEPAAPADDVYGLGALAYELLSGYPPFYPDFDAQRVQTQMPPAVQPVHPAPPRLTRLVMQMLAREPGARPHDMSTVIDALEEALADTLSLEEAGTTLIREERRDVVAAAGSGRSSQRLLRTGAALAAGLAVLAMLVLWLRQRDAVAPALPPAPLQPVSAVSEALAPAADTSLEGASRQLSATEQSLRGEFERELVAGRLALERGQPALARIAFARAASLIPDTPETAQGLQATDRLERVLERYNDAVRAQAAGQPAQALQQLDAALAIDPAFTPARSMRERLDADRQQKVQRETQLHEHQQRLARDARDAQVGRELEAAERWQDAATLYQAVLDRDPSQGFALEGLVHSQRRAQIDAQLIDLLARPQRLTAASVRRSAEQLLAAARQMTPVTPRLQQQLEQLSVVLSTLDVETRVEITSDNTTQVSIARVGSLGVFNSRELGLRPGSYTVIGTRTGFRDVRRELRIEPGQRSLSLAVACTEPI